MELSSHLDLNPLKRLPPLEVLSSAAHLARQEVIWSLSMLEDLPPLPGAPNKMGRTSDSGIWKSYLQEWLAGEHPPEGSRGPTEKDPEALAREGLHGTHVPEAKSSCPGAEWSSSCQDAPWACSIQGPL